MPRKVYSSVYASVRFYGDGLDPLDVTRALELPPDRQHRRNEPNLKRDRNGKVLAPHNIFRGGLWLVSSKLWVTSRRLSTHVVWLLDQLEPVADRIEVLLSVTGVSGDIFCFSQGQTSHSPTLPAEVRARAEALRLPIDIDHYDVTNQPKDAGV